MHFFYRVNVRITKFHDIILEKLDQYLGGDCTGPALVLSEYKVPCNIPLFAVILIVAVQKYICIDK